MKSYSKFEYAQKKVNFLAELDERLASQLEWWEQQLEQNTENYKNDECDYYKREVACCEAALDALADLRAMLEKQI